MAITALEVEILKLIERGEVPALSTTHRVRLEMLGLVKDGAKGL